jgi:hypothetical protein
MWLSLPEGSIFEILTAPGAGDRTVMVLCNGKPFIMFIRDLADRSAKVSSD